MKYLKDKVIAVLVIEDLDGLENIINRLISGGV